MTLKPVGKLYARRADNGGHWIYFRTLPSIYNWEDWQIDSGMENHSLREIVIKHFPNLPKEMSDIRDKQSKMK